MRCSLLLALLALAACTTEPPPFDGPDFASTCGDLVAQSGKVDQRDIEGFAITSKGAGYVNIQSRHTSQVWQCSTNPNGTVIVSETTRPVIIQTGN
jgi:hypothetical protein